MKINWDGSLPIRRYAIFNTLLRGDYAVVIKGKDIKTAEQWGGFVRWIGPVRPAEQRRITE